MINCLILLLSLLAGNSARIAAYCDSIANSLVESDESATLRLLRKCMDETGSAKEFQLIGQYVSNVGRLYQDINPTLSRQYLSRAIAFDRILGIPSMLPRQLNTLSQIEMKLGNYAEAKKLAHESISISAEIGSTNILAQSYLQLSDCYLSEGDFALADSLCKLAVDMLERSKVSQKGYIPLAYEQLGKINSQAGNDSVSRFAYSEMLRTSQIVGDSMLVFRACDALSLLCPDNDYYAKRASELSYIPRLEETANKIAVSNIEFIIHQQEREIESKSQYIIYLILFLLFLLLTVLLVSVLAIRHKKLSKQIAHQNETLERLFSIISHDLKSPASAQLITVKALSSEMPDNKIVTELLKNAESQSELVENLLLWAKLRHSDQLFQKVRFDMVAAVNEAVEAIVAQAAAKGVELTVSAIESKLVVEGNRPGMMTIVRNVVSNAIKFTQSGGHVFVRLDNAGLTVSDDGVGMNDRELNLLNDGLLKKNGTAGEKGNGLGVSICREIARLIDVTITYSSVPGKGTKVSIRF